MKFLNRLKKDDKRKFLYNKQKRDYFNAKGNPSKYTLQKEYKKYLKSPEWRAKRERALKFYKNRCAICNVPAAMARLHVHHRTYNRFGGKERMDDLIVLCEMHHKNFHENDILGLWYDIKD